MIVKSTCYCCSTNGMECNCCLFMLLQKNNLQLFNLYISKSWSVAINVATLLLSHIIFHVISLFVFYFPFIFIFILLPFFLNCAKHMMTIYILMTLHILNSLNSFALNYASFYLFIYFASPFFFNCAKHMMTLYILMTLQILNSLNSFALNCALLLLLKSFF